MSSSESHSAAASTPTRLLIVDDDQELCALLADYLGSAGFLAESVHDAPLGVCRALSGGYGAVVLDVMLPGFDGFEALRRIREHSRVPVIMLTARGEEADRIVGLDSGADDYLPKPFNPRELVARLRAVLRRSGAGDQIGVGRGGRVVVGDLEIECGTRSVLCNGRPIDLTSTEFDLLEALARSAGRVVSREALSQNVFGRPLYPEDRSIDVHVSHLRRKLGTLPGGGERIKTLRGSGYFCVLAGAGPTPTGAASPVGPTTARANPE